MISERTLKQWRKEALIQKPFGQGQGQAQIMLVLVTENDLFRERILRLTQELTDIYLVKKGI